MQIGDKHIIVPQEGTGDWPANWRYEVASVTASTGLYAPKRVVAEDPWIDMYSHYLQLDLDFYGGEVPDERLEPYHIASTWYGNPDINSPRFKIEPQLLTGAEYDMIADNMGVSKESIEVYEKLFFNTRDAKGTLIRGCYNRSRMAFDANEIFNEDTGDEVIWKAVGFSLGYAPLMKLWHWEQEAARMEGHTQGLFDEMWRFTQSYLLDRILRNQVRAFDLNNMMGNYVQHQRMRFDTKQETNDGNASAQILIQLLAQLQPHINPAAKTIDGENVVEQTGLIVAKLTREAEIQGEKLQASGAGNSILDEMMRASMDQKQLEVK